MVGHVLTEAGQDSMAVRRENEVGVDLVRDQEHIVLPADPDNLRQFVTGPDTPDRVVRRAQDHQAHAGIRGLGGQVSKSMV
jgi:hypothetical protein